MLNTILPPSSWIIFNCMKITASQTAAFSLHPVYLKRNVILVITYQFAPCRTNCMPFYCISSMQTKAVRNIFLAIQHLPVFSAAGEPGQLEASLRQLDQALDAGRYHLQQREASASRSSPDMDSTYMGYVSPMCPLDRTTCRHDSGPKIYKLQHS